ncbi:MAG: GTPase ObgE, partial [Acetobacter sp.]|nr:GTPase ObgE [Acetobacter sp.]
CAILLHLIDATEEDVITSWHTIRQELDAYDTHLAQKPEIIALNKIDALTPSELSAKQTALQKTTHAVVEPISAVTQAGIPPLLRLLQKHVKERA